MVMGMMYSLAALAMLVAGVLLLIGRGQSEPARNAACLRHATHAGTEVVVLRG